MSSMSDNMLNTDNLSQVFLADEVETTALSRVKLEVRQTI